jgi:hypothetical protein
MKEEIEGKSWLLEEEELLENIADKIVDDTEKISGLLYESKLLDKVAAEQIAAILNMSETIALGLRSVAGDLSLLRGRWISALDLIEKQPDGTPEDPIGSLDSLSTASLLKAIYYYFSELHRRFPRFDETVQAFIQLNQHLCCSKCGLFVSRDGEFTGGCQCNISHRGSSRPIEADNPKNEKTSM